MQVARECTHDKQFHILPLSGTLNSSDRLCLKRKVSEISEV
jgi:hypothetical protein